MEYRKLGNTDIEVSLICLGTMTWGQQNSQAEAFEQMDWSVEQGVNFFDAAEMYPVPPMAETSGRTEEILGNWLSERKCRDKITLASKVIGPAAWLPHIRDGKSILNRKNVTEALENSLNRLKTDYIDLYQIHWPGRNTNYFGKRGFVYDSSNEGDGFIEESMEVLSDLCKQGKIRHVGLSNETPWGVMNFLKLHEQNKGPRMLSIQNPYSLLNRSYEVGLAEVSHRENIGLLAYSPLAFGVLSGKYLDGKKPEGARLTLWGERFSRYTSSQAEEATRAYLEVAKKYDLSLAQMALAFVNSRSFVTSNIIGATTMEQLKENLASVDIKLTQANLEDIEKVEKSFPSPCP